jgi:hypothetical protein
LLTWLSHDLKRKSHQLYLITLFEDTLIQILWFVLCHDNDSMTMMKRFTFWGSMQLDRDRRRLQSFFNGLTPSINHRDKFTRLEQMSSLLQLDRPSEVLDMWTPDNATDRTVWKLDANEVKKILTLRNDFNPRDIAALKL